MSEQTGIAYVHSTWNVYCGCTLAPGCEVRNRCWAAALAKVRGWNFEKPHLYWGKDVWRHPYRWDEVARRARMCRLVFASDLGDLFQDHIVVNRLRSRVWKVIRETPNVLYYLSNKVPENITRFLPTDWGEGYSNVWLAVTVTSSKTLHRMDILRDVPAALRAVSAEPLWHLLTNINLSGFGWLIIGGESGPQWSRSPMRLSWARELWAKARKSDCAYFFKQVSGLRDEYGIDALDRLSFGKTGGALQARRRPKTPFPLQPMPEKGIRFTDEEWMRYREAEEAVSKRVRNPDTDVEFADPRSADDRLIRHSSGEAARCVQEEYGVLPMDDECRTTASKSSPRAAKRSGAL